MAERDEPMIRVTREDLRALRLPWSALLANKGREFATKLRGGRIRGQGMIGSDAGTVEEGFRDLRGDVFHEYNLPQAWVERRQIPRAIHGRIPVKRACVIDLGCGPGTSTEVICRFADPTWTILAFDLTAHSIDAARERAIRGEFRNRVGERIAPRFYCQSVAEPLLADARPLGDATVDYAISGGVVGLYLSALQAGRLARELARVVRPGGYAALDAGPAVSAEALERLMTRAGFECVGRVRSFVIEPRPKVVFRRLPPERG